jgi:hypothetical protein
MNEGVENIGKINIWKWGLLAVFVRIIFMIIGFHGDVLFINSFPCKFVYEGVLDIYSYFNAHFGSESIVMYYPPLTYWIIGISQYILKPLHGGLFVWINEIQAVGGHKWLLSEAFSPEVYRYLFLMKLPYLGFDLICILVMGKFASTQSSRERIFKLWCFNPVVLYGTYLFG